MVPLVLILLLVAVCAVANLQTATFTSANVFMPLGVDNAWDLKDFKDNFQIKVCM